MEYFNQDYQDNFIKFMSYVDNDQTYGRHTEFSLERRGAITPNDIKRFMCQKAFGTPEPGATDLPKKCRSTTLDVYKKSISFYMPNRNMKWNELTLTGNPTMSTMVNNVIAIVAKHECNGRGVITQAKRGITPNEFRKVLDLQHLKGTFQCRYRYTTMMKLQYHLIGRCDDMAHFKLSDIRCHKDLRFRDFSLQVKMKWGKTIRDERKCPDQILLGAMDSDYCIILALAVYF